MVSSNVATVPRLIYLRCEDLNLNIKLLNNKENNAFKDGIGVKGLRFKLHGNNHGNHLEHYGIHHDNHGNHHGVIITVIKVIKLG